MKGTKYKLNIDKLEICYTATEKIYSELKNTAYQEREGYRLTAIGNENKNITILQVDVLFPDEERTWLKYGTIRIGSTFDNEDNGNHFIWLRLSNESFYTGLYPNEPIISFLYFIADDLNLKYNNITAIDIAIDSNINFSKHIKKEVRSKEYVPIILGKAYNDMREIIKPLIYIHTGDRNRYRTETIVVSNKEKSCSLCAYNKSEELDESDKDYIKLWDKMESNIFRLEIRLKRTSLLDYLDKKDISFTDLYCSLNGKEMLFDMFLFFMNRLIRFRKDRNSLSLLEI